MQMFIAYCFLGIVPALVVMRFMCIKSACFKGDQPLVMVKDEILQTTYLA